jgi:hypothetical protein
MTRKRAVLLSLAALAGVFYYVGWVRVPPGPRSHRVFNADRLADLEVDMWKAYYAKERVRLFRLLVVSLHEQYRYSWARAARVAFLLARAASRFGDLRGDYEQVLPDLEKAYLISKEWTGSSYDPKAVARAELAWWVARRIPGQNSPEQVGALIAVENGLIYSLPPDRVLEASVLRARAGKLRDEGGEGADWAKVSELLRASYRELHRAVN